MNANAKSPGDDDQKESHKALSLDFPSMSHQERCKYKFPVKLYAALANPEVSDVISWLPHGRSWIVRKPKEFVEKVSSKYFGYTKFSSFTRTANSWGFYRLKAGFDQGSYYNEFFLRGHPELLEKMTRFRADGKKKKKINEENEPDFSKMPPLTEDVVLQPSSGMLTTASDASSSEESVDVGTTQTEIQETPDLPTSSAGIHTQIGNLPTIAPLMAHANVGDMNGQNLAQFLASSAAAAAAGPNTNQPSIPLPVVMDLLQRHRETSLQYVFQCQQEKMRLAQHYQLRLLQKQQELDEVKRINNMLVSTTMSVLRNNTSSGENNVDDEARRRQLLDILSSLGHRP